MSWQYYDSQGTGNENCNDKEGPGGYGEPRVDDVDGSNEDDNNNKEDIFTTLGVAK